MAKNLRCQGAIPTMNQAEADMCILLSYGINDESYMTRIPIPIWGQTGISSITTISNTRGSVSGSAYLIGDYVYGSAYGSSKTTTSTQVTPTYGITGVYSVDKRVNNFKRHINIYAYDNKARSKNEPVMLWKTYLISNGYSGDIGRVFPYMMFSANGVLGRNTNGLEHTVFDNDYIYKLWLAGNLSASNVTVFPRCNSDYSGTFDVAIVQRNYHNTIVVIRKSGCLDTYSFSPTIYLKTNGRKFKVSDVKGYLMGSKIRNECGIRYFVFEFPVILSSRSKIDIIEYTDKNETIEGYAWRNITVY